MNIYSLIIVLFLLSLTISICQALVVGANQVKRLHQIPCSNCAFFTGDYRLKCTIHSCKALSEEAIDCMDYESISVATRINYLTPHHKQIPCQKNCSLSVNQQP